MNCQICLQLIKANTPIAWILKPRTYKPAHRNCVADGLIIPSPQFAKTETFVMMPSRRGRRHIGAKKYRKRCEFYKLVRG